MPKCACVYLGLADNNRASLSWEKAQISRISASCRLCVFPALGAMHFYFQLIRWDVDFCKRGGLKFLFREEKRRGDRYDLWVPLSASNRHCLRLFTAAALGFLSRLK